MSTGAIVTMVVILAFVWGGFCLALATAVRSESVKKIEVSRARPH